MSEDSSTPPLLSIRVVYDDLPNLIEVETPGLAAITVGFATIRGRPQS